jgi:hypothetical protein
LETRYGCKNSSNLETILDCAALNPLREVGSKWYSWEADVKEVTPGVIRKLDENFFRVRFDRLTPSEKKYLRAMAELGAGPHRSGDVVATLMLSVQSVAPVRSSFIRKGMTYSPAHVVFKLAVSLFAAFMRRSMPMEKGAFES